MVNHNGSKTKERGDADPKAGDEPDIEAFIVVADAVNFNGNKTKESGDADPKAKYEPIIESKAAEEDACEQSAAYVVVPEISQQCQEALSMLIRREDFLKEKSQHQKAYVVFEEAW